MNHPCLTCGTSDLEKADGVPEVIQLPRGQIPACLVNAKRTAAGLGELKWSIGLEQAAQVRPGPPRAWGKQKI